MQDLREVKALVVDDMDSSITYVINQLKAMGLDPKNITTAKKIADAFKQVNDKINIILCDYYLGDGRTGKDFIEELRKEEKISEGVACVMITADTRLATVIGSAENGIDGYFIKPWSPGEFQRRISLILEKKALLKPVYSLIDKGQYQKVVELCDTYLSDSVCYGHLKYSLRKIRAESLYKMGLIHSALRSYESVLGEHDIPWASHGKAVSLVKLREYKEAEKIFLELKEKYPHYMVCYDDLAELYGLQNNYSDQGRVMRQAIEKSPEKFHRHRELANLSLLNNDLSVAEEMLRILHKKGIHSPHVDSSTIYRYAQVLKLGGKKKEGIDFLQSLHADFRRESHKLITLRAITEVYDGRENLSLPVIALPPEVRLDYAVQCHHRNDTSVFEYIYSTIPPEAIGIFRALYPNIPVGIDLKLEQHINNQHFQKSNQLKDLLRSTLKIGNWDEARNTLLLQLEDVKKHPDLIEPAILFFTRSIHKLDYFAFDREIAQILYKLLENLSQDETQKARCRLAMKQSGIL